MFKECVVGSADVQPVNERQMVRNKDVQALGREWRVFIILGRVLDFALEISKVDARYVILSG